MFYYYYRASAHNNVRMRQRKWRRCCVFVMCLTATANGAEARSAWGPALVSPVVSRMFPIHHPAVLLPPGRHPGLHLTSLFLAEPRKRSAMCFIRKSSSEGATLPVPWSLSKVPPQSSTSVYTRMHAPKHPWICILFLSVSCDAGKWNLTKVRHRTWAKKATVLENVNE